uniref:Uncharacterized protein n=1 Tax=Cacopsylla melanoneura TaxID=428564 RepID=A0A8D8X5V9_9HEMI
MIFKHKLNQPNILSNKFSSIQPLSSFKFFFLLCLNGKYYHLLTQDNKINKYYHCDTSLLNIYFNVLSPILPSAIVSGSVYIPISMRNRFTRLLSRNKSEISPPHLRIKLSIRN